MNKNIVVIGSLEEKRRVELKTTEDNARTIAFFKYGLKKEDLFYAYFFVSFQDKNKLGSYNSTDNVILLSEELLYLDLKDVQNVFLHECAHSLDYHVCGRVSGHGIRFKEFCDALGVEEDFTKAKIRKEFKRDEKIEKLLALSSSPYEGEAQNAISKAQELIKERRREEVVDEEKIYQVDLYECKKQPFCIRVIKSFVQDVTGVCIVDNIQRNYPTDYEYYLGMRSTSTTLVRAYGKIDEVEGSLYLFNYLLSSVDIEIKKLKTKERKTSRDSFTIAMIEELRKKVLHNEKDNAIVAINKENEDLAKRLVFKEGGISTKTNHTYSQLNKDSYEEGKRFGQNIDLERNKTKQIDS